MEVDEDNGWYETDSGTKRKVITTKGWKICVEWKDGTQSWVPLCEIKESNPVELYEYAIIKGIDKKQELNWWVPFTLKNRNNIISKIKSKPIKKGMNFGVIIPSSIKHAYQIDRELGNNHWKNSIKKEIDSVIIAFKLIDEDEKLPIGSNFITYHFIFDIKMDITRNERLVSGGHMNRVPHHVTYSSVIYRESVRIGFLIYSLNVLDITSSDISN